MRRRIFAGVLNGSACASATVGLACVALSASLAGCGSGSAHKSGSDAAIRREVFDQYVQDNDLTQYATLDKLHDAATAICGIDDHGGTFMQVIATLTRNGWSGTDAGKLNGAAVADYCPKHIADQP